MYFSENVSMKSLKLKFCKQSMEKAVHCVWLYKKHRVSGSSVVKMLGYSLEGREFKPQRHHATTVGTLSKSLNPQLLRWMNGSCSG